MYALGNDCVQLIYAFCRLARNVFYINYFFNKKTDGKNDFAEVSKNFVRDTENNFIDLLK